MNTYYLICDRQLGMKNEEGWFLYKEGEWTKDVGCVIEDHLHGFDPTEEPDSPYRFGNGAVMREMSEITFAEAKKYMEPLEK